MIGGEQAAFDKAKPYFDLMGKVFYYCGAAGQGLQAKLTQNLILANIMQAFAEGMVLATKGGVAPELMLEILNNSAAKSGLISYKAPFIFCPRLQDQFRHQVDGQGYRAGARIGQVHGCSAAGHRADRADATGHHRPGMGRGRLLLNNPGFGRVGRCSGSEIT